METQREARFLRSTRLIVQLMDDRHADIHRKLRRLTSIAVADFPRALFKLQTLGDSATLRVVPEFVTPMLQTVADRHRGSFGPLDVRDMIVPTDENSLVTSGALSYEETRLNTAEEIRRYLAAYVPHADRDTMAGSLLKELGIREVLLLPVRPDDLPFGVLSIASQSRLGEPASDYWRTVAVAITSFYAAERASAVQSLRRLAFNTARTPTVLVGAYGEVLDANHSACAALGYADRAEAIGRLGNMRACLPEERSPDDDPTAGRTFYVRDAHGDEVPFVVRTIARTDTDGRTLGAVIRLVANDVAPAESPRLTRRQREVGRLIAAGMSTKEVAADLGLSPHTVHYHRTQIRRRLADDASNADLTAQIRQYFVGNR